MLTTTTIAKAAQDRLDTLLAGQRPAAQYRVLRLIDPAAASAFRASCPAFFISRGLISGSAQPAEITATSRAGDARARVAALLGGRCLAQDLAA